MCCWLSLHLPPFARPPVRTRAHAYLIQEYELGDSSLTLADRVAKQRQHLKERLGAHRCCCCCRRCCCCYGRCCCAVAADAAQSCHIAGLHMQHVLRNAWCHLQPLLLKVVGLMLRSTPCCYPLCLRAATLLNFHAGSAQYSHRRLLLLCAGLGKGMADVVDTDELVNEDDIKAALETPFGAAAAAAAAASAAPSAGGTRGGRSADAGDAMQQRGTLKQAAASLLASGDSLSARERNKLKRKAKALQRCESSKGSELRGRVRLVGWGGEGVRVEPISACLPAADAT